MSIAQNQQQVKIEFVVITSEPPASRACASCGAEFAPQDDTHVVCPACEQMGIQCGCVLGESCSICEAVVAIVYGGEELPF